jgi:DinB superfamily
MKKLLWFERQFTFGLPPGMLPFYLERLAGTIIRLEEKVKGYPEDMLSAQLNTKWSVKQNIGHLAEVDQIASRRIDEIVAGISPLSPAVMEPRGDYNQQPIQEVLSFFKEQRTNNIARYRNLEPPDLQKSSQHPRLNVPLTPVDLAWFDAEHDDHHLVTINELLITFSAVPLKSL